MFRLKTAVARLVRAVTRRLGKGGTTAPGRVLLKLDEGAMGRLGKRLEGGAMLISATNGKTTTASLLNGILEHAGRSVVRNRAGSNMHWGVTTALLDAGRAPGELGLLEVDEAWLPRVSQELDPRAFLLGNLFRDQLDRYGERGGIADRWAEVVAARAGGSAFVLNADDPLVADLGRERPQVTYFGVEDDGLALPELQHAADSKHCRRCGHAYEYDAVYLAHMGRYRCPNCGRERPTPSVAAERVTLRGMDGTDVVMRLPDGERIELSFPLPGLYNVYNALGAAAAAVALGVESTHIGAALSSAAAVFGRVERLRVNDRDVAILLVKNPAGANEVLRTLTLEDGQVDLWIALNDRIADGRDVSWVWDADFELLAPRIRHVTCAGTRAEEMALRLKYAGIEAKADVERNLGRSIDAAVARGDASRPLYALPTYTALLDLRDLLSARGAVARWSE